MSKKFQSRVGSHQGRIVLLRFLEGDDYMCKSLEFVPQLGPIV
jgi:hypothetical protein